MKTTGAAELRRRAEARLLVQQSSDAAPGSTDQTLRLVHELQVHQIELEMQNEELRCARTELEEMMGSYTDLYDFAPVGYLTLERNGAVTLSNLAGARLLGSERARLLGQNVVDYVAKSSQPTFKAFLLQTFTQEHPAPCDLEVVSRSGEIVQVHVEAAALPDKQSCRLMMVDVTARKRAEADLRESNAFNESLLQSIPFGMNIVDEQGRVLFLNRVMADAVGSQALGQHCWELYKDNRQPCAGCPLKQPLHLGETKTVESSSALGGRTFEISHTAIIFQGKKALLEVFFDVTGRNQAAERLRRQAALLDAASDAIYVRSLERRVTYWNRGAERLYGWTEAEAMGRQITDLGDENPAEFDVAEKTLITQGSWTGELKKKSKAGRLLTVFCRWTLLRDAHGAPAEVLAINTDITEQKLLEAKFLRAQRSETIGTLASGVAHDLNNILSPIMIAAPLLRSALSDEHDRAMVDMLASCAKRGAEITRHLLTYAKGRPDERLPLAVRHLFREMQEIVRETFPKNIRTNLDVPPDLWPVIGDITQIHQALMNLCVNARDAMPDGGILSLSAANVAIDEAFAAAVPEAKTGNFVCLRVVDTGTGIQPENLARIFDPFFTTKEVGKGTGLGLATVHGIARGHHGFVRVLTTLGVGSTFEVYLPATAVSPTVTETSDQAELAPRGSGELILVVDDERNICRVTRIILEKNGYRVLTAFDGVEALALFAEHRAAIRAVVTDMMMAEMDGPKLIKNLRRLAPHLPIVGMSGLSDRVGVPRDENQIALPLLTKPFTTEAILNALHHELVTAKALPPAEG